MAEEVVSNEVIQEAATAAVSPEDQAAIDRYRESIGEKEKPSVVDTDYNEDGTPKEELIAGKFKSQEDLLKAYQELEKKLGQPKVETPATDPEPSPQAEPADTGFNTSKYEQEFVEKGALSDDSYAELAKKGFTKEQVDAYIKGQTAYADSVRNEVYNSVGGQEEYLAVINWASANLDQSIIGEYNAAVDSLDKDKVLRTLEYMKFKKEQSVPREPRRLEGDSPASGVQPFSNKNEWQRAMTDRLYGKDAKYTKMVDSRYLAARKKGIL